MKKSEGGKLILPLIQTVIFICGFIASSYCQGSYKYPPTGKLVDAGGHLLHLHVMGKGEPAVIFENGSGDFSFVWDLVQPSVSKTATTVSYDRAGYAWSEEGPLPRTGRQVAFELHTALHNAGIKGPYIMVGQSYGGFLVRSFARLYKKEVVGLVLVDALNENEKILIKDKAIRVRDMAQGRTVPEIQTTMQNNIDTDTSDHTNPVASNINIEPPLDKLSIDDQKKQLWAQTQFSYFKAASNEMDWSPEDVADMYKNRGRPDYTLGDIPLIVLAKGRGYYAGLPDSAELEKQRLDLQKDLTHLSTNSKLIVDKNSGHNIHLEDPATVMNAIMQVILACKTNSKLQ